MNEVKEEKKKSNAGLIAIIMVLCLCLGIAVGFIISKELGKNDKKDPDTKIEEKKPEEKKEENKEEKKEEKPEEKKEETPTTPQKKTAVLDLKNECFNKGNCEKSFEITNGVKSYNILIKRDSTFISTYINGKEMIKSYHASPSVGNTLMNSIAILDNDYLVIEEKQDLQDFTTRYYFDSNLNKIREFNDIMYDDDHRITDGITSKEITFIDTGCEKEDFNSDGSVKGKKYKLILNDNDKYEIKSLGTDNLMVGGNC